MSTTDLDLENDIFVVVTERDHHDALRSHGAIIHETHPRKANLYDTLERAIILGQRYGKATIFKLVPVGDVEHCTAICDGKIPVPPTEEGEEVDADFEEIPL